MTKLLEDISAGKVDLVAVYKVDRLTRSLSDFARIVVAFDAKGVSFFSVKRRRFPPGVCYKKTTALG